MSCVNLPHRSPGCELKSGQEKPWNTCQEINEYQSPDEFDCTQCYDMGYTCSIDTSGKKWPCCKWSPGSKPGPPPKPGPPKKPGPGSPGASSKSSLPVGAIVGFSVGGLFLLIAIILGIKFLSEKKKGGKKSK